MTSTWRTARDPNMAPWRVLVAIAWFTAGLCILLGLSDIIRFTYHDSDSGIVAWVKANKYPKQQEVFWFLATVVGVPALVLRGLFAWLRGSAATARLSQRDPQLMLRLNALWHLPLLIVWPRMIRLQTDAWKLLIPAAASMVIMAVLTTLVARYLPARNRQPSPPTPPDTPDTPSKTPRDTTTPDRPQRVPSPHIEWLRHMLLRTWRIAVWLLFYVAVPGFFYLLYLNPGCDRSIDLFHEGELLIPLDELLHGSIPYRDIYLQHGLFHNAWIPYLGAKLFEPTLLGVRTIQSYLAPLGYLGFYYLVLTVCRTRILPAAFLAFAGCSTLRYASERTLFGILSIAVLAAALIPTKGFRLLAPATATPDPLPRPRALLSLCLRHGWPLFLAGTLAMLAFWHSVEVGVYALTTGTLFLILAGTCRADIRVWRRPLPLACFLTGATTTFTPIALYLVFHGAFDDMIRNVWIQCMYQTETWGLPFPGFFGVFKPLLTAPAPAHWQDWLINGNTQFYFTPIMLTLAGAFVAFRAMGAGFWRSRTGPVLLLLTLAGASFFRTTLGRSDWYHVMSGFMFALVLLLFFADRLLATAWDRLTARRITIARRLLFIPWLAAALIAGAGVYTFVDLFKPLPAFQTRWERFSDWPPVTTATHETIPRAGRLLIPSNEVAQIKSVVSYIQAHSAPEERIYDFSSQAGFLFFAERRSASRYFQTCYACLPSMQAEVIADLESLRPNLVIYRAGNYYDAIDRVPATARHPPIANYLKENYVHATNAGKVAIWQRRPQRDLSATKRAPK